MKPFVKTLAGVTIFLLSVQLSQAQLTSPDNTIADDIKKVIEDYPNHFTNLMGELLIQNPQSSDYVSVIKPDGAEECTVTKYSANKKDICSWQALLLTTENFNEAKRKFSSLFTQLNNLVVGSHRLVGKYEKPEEEKNFTSVLFSFESANEKASKLRVEIVIESELMEWKVKLLVYDRERDDDERGQIEEN